MPYASSAFNEKPEIDPQVGMQVYLHEGAFGFKDTGMMPLKWSLHFLGLSV